MAMQQKTKQFHTNHNTHAGLTAMVPGEPAGFTGFPLDSSCPYILLYTIPLCLSRTGEGTAVTEEDYIP